jgi:hypothetical protein
MVMETEVEAIKGFHSNSIYFYGKGILCHEDIHGDMSRTIIASTRFYSDQITRDFESLFLQRLNVFCLYK